MLRRSSIGTFATVVVAVLYATVSGLAGQEPAAPVGRLGAAQVVPPPGASDAPATAVIAGRVLDAGTGSPIAGALVRHSRPTQGPPVLLDPATAAAQNAAETALTNAGGYFVLRNLAKGSYSLFAQAGGYIEGTYGRKVPEGPGRVAALESGERLVNADILMWRTGAISGTVLDEAGEPVVGTQVQGLRRLFSGGRVKLSPTGSTSTDDRGFFRLGNLVPGEYVVAVPAGTTIVPAATADAYIAAMTSGGMTPSDPNRSLLTQLMNDTGGTVSLTGAGVRTGELIVQQRGPARPLVLSAAGPVFAYRTALFPATALSTDAPGLAIGSGEERTGITLRLELTPTWKVSGTVTGPGGPATNVALRLLPEAADDLTTDWGFDVATTISDGSGRFTFVGVPPGGYLLRVRKTPAPSVSAASTTTVINMGSTGTVMMSAAPPAPPTAAEANADPALSADLRLQVSDRDLSGVAIALRTGARVSGQMTFAGAAPKPTPEQLGRMLMALRPVAGGGPIVNQPIRPDLQGRFVSASHAPGLYNLTVPAPAPWTLRSMTVNGRETAGWPLQVDETDLEVAMVFTDRPTSITGGVRGAVGTTPTAASILLFPADVDRWIAAGMPEGVRRTIGASDSGSFSVSGLPPGDYLAVAVAATDTADLQSPATYRTLAREATRFTLGDAGTAALTLSIARAGGNR